MLRVSLAGGENLLRARTTHAYGTTNNKEYQHANINIFVVGMCKLGRTFRFIIYSPVINLQRVITRRYFPISGSAPLSPPVYLSPRSLDRVQEPEENADEVHLVDGLA